jgi:hypothetical protein
VQENILPYDEIMPKKKKNTVRLEHVVMGE